ncbi:hypothetical protein ERUR111494_08075 [Erysipelothrix urinaevulpis]|uniref:hypothetical protein n=1 Tax=Erysipelothrix urinaevulpis TaxID=2683717 RepID=UPI001358C4A5|nr:hypothetical protein [Erysipelothrix urinaevulpis]
MPYKISESWLLNYDNHEHRQQVEKFIDDYRQYLLNLPTDKQKCECISKMNQMKRKKYWSCNDININITCGDICYVDFGVGYINECSYQHFGIILKMMNHKVYVLPMTSNKRTVEKSKLCEKDHLFYIGQPEGLHKETCTFINDGRFINSARVISVNAHIDTDCKLFKELNKVVIENFCDKI